MRPRPYAGLLGPGVLRGAWWAVRAVRGVRRQLAYRRHDEIVVPAPPRAVPGADRGVHAVLRRLRPSCLERSLVLQRWLAARGDRRAVVIGVEASGGRFRAHAWLEGEPAPGFQELTRVR
jgi:hypothetical protein